MTRIRLTVPDLVAGMWFIVFIASMIRTVWPPVPALPTVTKGAALFPRLPEDVPAGG